MSITRISGLLIVALCMFCQEPVRGQGWIFGELSGPGGSKVHHRVSVEGRKFENSICYYTGISLPNAGAGLVFDTAVDLTSDVFEGEVDMRSGRYGETASFSRDTFWGPVDFTYSNFSQDAFFDYCQFDDYADFNMVEFKEHADFSNALFGHVAFFSGLRLANPTELSFTLAVLPDTLDLSENTSIVQPIELTDASFTPSHVVWIYLNRTNISMIHLDYIHFRLLFNDPKYESRPELSHDEKVAIYEELLNNFKSRGQTDSYQALDIEYRHFLANGFWGWLTDSVELIWWNYGYWKWLVFVWAIGLILIFSAINYFRLNDLNNEVYKIEGIPEFPVLKRFSFSWERGLKRFWYSIVYTSNIFFRLTLETEKIRYNRILASMYIFVIYVLGIVCLGYMANFVLQK